MRTEDGYVVQKCLNGDPAAFGLLVDKYRESIYGLAYSKLGNFHDAEDVTQEVFLRAYQKLRTLKRYDSFLAWLYSITTNLCKNWLRTRSRRPDKELIEDRKPETFSILSIDSYRQENMLESVREAVDSLPEIYRQVLILHYLSGMSGKEIARLLGTSSGNIRQRLLRARALLREEMHTMVPEAFKEQRLRVGFTFRIIEAVKRLKIQPTQRSTNLPWGLSLAAGAIIAVMSMGSHLSTFNPIEASTFAALPSKTKVIEAGEIPVDIFEIDQIPILASKQGDGDGGNGEFLSPQKALFMAPDGETTFSEVSEDAGISDEAHGYGATFADYDNDGDLDIYVSNWGTSRQPNKLYRNNDDGTFTDIADEAGVANERATANAVFGDYDNDGDPDLFIVNGIGIVLDVLYRNNGDGTFTNVTEEAGIQSNTDGKIGTFWDYDNDGYLDISATSFERGIVLYRNNGDGTFTDVSRKVGATLPVAGRWGHSAAVGDYDNDGDLDLFAPELYRNNGDGTFTDVGAKTGILNANPQGGVTLGDYNNDGDLDVYMVLSSGGSVLYSNNGDGTFNDVTEKAGVGNSSRCCHGAMFIDYDNDGYLDIYAVDKHLYRNNGDGTFTNVIGEVGAVSTVPGVQYYWSATFGDYDKDGYLDLYLPRAGNYNAPGGPSDELFRNNGNDNHWLHIKTVGTQSNRDGIGARVTVKAGNLSQIRDVVSEQGRSCPPVQFGLGEHLRANSIEIRWPSGHVDTLLDVPVDQFIVVKEGLGMIQGQAVEPSDKLPSTWGKVKISELYQNFPNPFNPETWIPYQLSEDSSVVIKIHTPSGQLVRTLDLGDKPAGIYTDKTMAVHWDGANEAGEPVASGVYFYTIQTADDYTATMKMVIAR